MASSERREPAHMSIARDLGVEIVTGRREPGSLLPGEVELAERLGVARNVVREALRMLAARGLVESRPKTGTRIRERRHWAFLDPVVLSWMFEGAPPLAFVRSLFELRMIVEPAAAALAAQSRDARQLARMGQALEEMAAHGLSTPEGQSADQRFHAIILEATGNELLVSLSAGISAAVRWTTFFKYRTKRPPRDPLPDHRVLFEAIARGDAAGAQAATEALVRQARLDTEAALKA